MKIEDILLENDTLKEVDGLKPEERLGSRIASWFKRNVNKDNPELKAQRAQQSLEKYDDKVQQIARQNTLKNIQFPSDKAFAKPSKDLDSIVFPSEKKLAQQKLDKYDDRAMRLVRQNKGGREAFSDPSTLRDTVKVGQPNRARDARGQDMTRADAVAQADAKFKTNTPVAKTSKYPKGDIRNLGKYIKPANVTSQNQGGKKMAGDVEPQKKGADLRNLLKLAGVNRPDGSAKDNK